MSFPFHFIKTEPVSADQQGLEKENKVFFRWAFGAIAELMGESQLIPITGDMVLKTGDKLQMLIDIQTECFIYVFYQSSQNEIYLLFPPNLDTDDYKTPKKYYVPKIHMWFELDEHTGKEIFYLLASARPLGKLESIYKLYSSSTASSQKQDLSRQLLSEIRKTKQKRHPLTAVAERPVRLGGSVRGIEKDKAETVPSLDNIAIEITAPDFFSRTFTIDHR
jgi:hypothetical protein